MTELNEGRHPAEFILTEANGQRSRGSGRISYNNVVVPGQIVKVLNAATTDSPTEYAPLVAGAGNAAAAIVIYGAAPISGTPIDVAVIQRDAEVNGKILTWPAGIDNTQKAAALTALAALGVIVR